MLPVALVPAQRPEPPDELTDEEKQYWRVTTNRMPPDWFTPETFPMLVQLCQHVTQSKYVAAQLAAVRGEWEGDDEGLKQMNCLSQMFERESRMIANLMAKMRLTQSSRYTNRKSGTAAEATAVRKAWED